MMPFVSRSFPVEEGSSSGKLAQGLRLLIITDPRCVNEPLHPNRFDSWGTVYGYFIIRSLQQHGAYVEIESIDEAVIDTFPRIGNDAPFDHAIFIVNRVSDLYPPELFVNVRKKLRPGGKLFSLDDHDKNIVHEDMRFCATITSPNSDVDKKKQVFWGADSDIFYSDKDEDTLRILLDTWHFEERKWDRTREILQSAIDNVELFDLEKIGKKNIEIIAWGSTGPEIFSCDDDIERLVRIPARIRFDDMVDLLSSTDIFMVTHSESMGLTILEAAVSGCLVAIPTPLEGDREIGHFIKRDLASTIPHFEYSMNEGKVDPPWNEMLEHIDSKAIRKDSIDLDWSSVARRMIGEFGRGSGPSAGSADERIEYSFDDRSRMVATKNLISESNPSPESISNFIMNWYNNPNFDSDTKATFFNMLEKSLDSKLDPDSWFRNRCLQQYSIISGLPVEVIVTIERLGGDLDKPDRRLNLISKILSDFDTKGAVLDVGEGDRRKILLENLEILSENDFLHFMLDPEGDANRSLGRILEEIYLQDFEILEAIITRIPHQMDPWKIMIRGHWNLGNHQLAISIANEALKHHPEDSWIQEIANRGV
tara:strand:- start:58 stop:1839 length:1782 start_codon:yes stop_codon:yes gene_type:complete